MPRSMLLLSLALCGCRAAEGAPAARGEPSAAETPSVAPEAATTLPVYPWGPSAVDRLDERFPAPRGFSRGEAPSGTFAAFLRRLPLLPLGSKAVDYRGSPLYGDGHHPNVAAIVDIDVGVADLQQCADAVIRLHAEWRYGRGERDIAYRSVSGVTIPYRRYMSGERATAAGGGLVFVHVRSPRDDHALFRSYLDDVFTWANTASLERDSARVDPSDVRGGDFFLMTGVPVGHTVLVLDTARDDRGRRALLLGQSYMPAQSFQVLRPGAASDWFVIEADATEIATPFWRPFPLGSLRRL